LSIEAPFTISEVSARLKEYLEDFPDKRRNVNADEIMNEFEPLLEKVEFSKYRFRVKWADIMDEYSAATGLVMEPYREIQASDRGKNEFTSKDRAVLARKDLRTKF
jgi:hypothetical protein